MKVLDLRNRSIQTLSLSLSFSLDPGGLEVRGDGAGPVVPLDLHCGRGGGDGGDHPAGPSAVRRPGPDRSSDVQDWSGQVLRQPLLWSQVLVVSAVSLAPNFVFLLKGLP